jgi:hypothetical protein
VTGGSVSLDKLGADVAQAASLREQLNYEIQEMYRAAGLSSGSPTQVAQPESGVAKAFAFNEIEARLSAIGSAAEHAENLVLQRALGDGYPGDATYPTTFDAPDLSAELDYLIRILTAPVASVLKEAAQKTYAAKAFSLTPEEQTEFCRQIEESTEQAQAVNASPFNQDPTSQGG